MKVGRLTVSGEEARQLGGRQIYIFEVKRTDRSKTDILKEDQCAAIYLWQSVSLTLRTKPAQLVQVSVASKLAFSSSFFLLLLTSLLKGELEKKFCCITIDRTTI